MNAIDLNDTTKYNNEIEYYSEKTVRIITKLYLLKNNFHFIL